MQKIEYGKAASIHSSSALETEKLGKECAISLLANEKAPRFVALYGDLGVVKTAFIRGFTSEIAPDSKVKSPTFAIVHEYKGKPLSVFHFDMYRIESEDELYSIGFYDYADRNGICLVEWSENIPFALPEKYLRVEIIKNSAEDTDSRRVEICAVGF